MSRTFAAVLVSLSVIVSVHAADHPRHDSAASAQPSAALADGEVRRIDKEAKKLTIRHGPLVDLDMPPMTMVFQVQDPAMLEQVKVGDRIRFQAAKIGGAYVVTRIEAARP